MTPTVDEANVDENPEAEETQVSSFAPARMQRSDDRSGSRRVVFVGAAAFAGRSEPYLAYRALVHPISTSPGPLPPPTRLTTLWT